MATKTASFSGSASGAVSATGTNSLLGFTKLVLGVSALVQLIFGIVGVFFLDLLNGFFWTAPLPVWSNEIAEFSFVNYLATAIAALYALKQGTWQGAKVYFAFSAPYNFMSILTAIAALGTTGIPPIMWAYVALAAIYVPVVAVVWWRQSRA